MRGMPAALAVVAGHHHHRSSHRLRFLKGEDRDVCAARRFADAAECGGGEIAGDLQHGVDVARHQRGRGVGNIRRCFSRHVHDFETSALR